MPGLAPLSQRNPMRHKAYRPLFVTVNRLIYPVNWLILWAARLHPRCTSQRTARMEMCVGTTKYARAILGSLDERDERCERHPPLAQGAFFLACTREALHANHGQSAPAQQGTQFPLRARRAGHSRTLCATRFPHEGALPEPTFIRTRGPGRGTPATPAERRRWRSSVGQTQRRPEGVQPPGRQYC